MPSTYAHYRFGAQILPKLPPDVRKSIGRYRRLFDIGLQGPDIFFYFNPAKQTAVGDLSGKYHAQSGLDFFTRVCKRQRLEPAEPGRAYLYGLLGHYCLDATCHPFIQRHTQSGPVRHSALETEFDRYLLEKDGRQPPHTQDLSEYLQLTKDECAVAAGFYSGVTPAHIGQCIRNMSLCARLLAGANSIYRRAMTALLDITGKYNDFVMPKTPDPYCARLDPELDLLYRHALKLYPVLLTQITGFLTCGIPLGQDFAPPFDIYTTKVSAHE